MTSDDPTPAELATVHPLRREVEPTGDVIDGEIITDDEYRRLTGQRELALARRAAYRADVTTAVRVTRAVATHDRTRTVGRAVLRHTLYVPAGATVVARRVWEARTNSRYERLMRAAEALGDMDRLMEWETRGENARQRRHTRRMDWIAAPLTLVKALALACAGVVGVLLALGAVLALANGDPGDVVAPIRGLIDLIGWVAWAFAVAWGPLILAAPWVVVLVLWQIGRSAGTTPGWLQAPRSAVGEPITPSKVVTAFRDLGIPALRKAATEMGDAGAGMLSPIVLAGCGIEVDVMLPSGVSTDEILQRHQRLAQNLGRHDHEVYVTVAPTPRTVRVWAADSGALDQPIGPSPLVLDPDMKADYRRGKAPWGNDIRGDAVEISLYQLHLLITGTSNQGKTRALMSLALWLALDPRVEFAVADLKGMNSDTKLPDWEPFREIATTFIAGPTDDHVIAATEMLEGAVDEMNRRLQEGGEWDPLVVLVDECFPCGTMVGGTPIERIRPGDIVPSWNENTGEPCEGVVTSTFKSIPAALVRVHWHNGDTLVCTPNHPLMTRQGWRSAGSLPENSEVLSYAEKDVPSSGERGVRNMWDRVPAVLDAAQILAPDGPGVLLETMQPGGDRCGSAAEAELLRGRPRGDRCKHEGEQPDAQPCRQGEGLSAALGYGPSAAHEGGERTWTDRAATDFGRSARVANRGDRPNRATPKGQSSVALQIGCRQRRVEDRHRSGWEITQGDISPGSGRAEDSMVDWRRVDRIEVLERGSDKRYGGLCPDGHVYNFEVAGTHTYRVADGVVAHNCQVAYMCPAKDAAGRPFGGAKNNSRFLTAVRMIQNQGRAVDVLLYQGTQDPTDQNLPVLAREGAHLRMCLAVGRAEKGRMALGDKAADGGAAPHLLRVGLDKGVVVVAGAGAPLAPGQSSVTVRTHYIDGAEASAIGERAKARRAPVQRRADAVEDRDLLDDVAAALGDDEMVRATDVAVRLRTLAPGHRAYVHLDGQRLVDLLDDDGVEVKRKDGYPMVRADRVRRALTDRDGAE